MKKTNRDYPKTIYLLRHTEKDGDEWFEAKESVDELDLPQNETVEIAEYDFGTYREAGFLLSLK